MYINIEQCIFENDDNTKMKIKVDENGEPVKDANGNFIFEPE